MDPVDWEEARFRSVVADFSALQGDNVVDRFDRMRWYDGLHPYAENRTTGSFILVDEATNVTAGAGRIQAD